ncbi:MAG: WD40/YVTN/BNR-like repeat-containing protein [Pyrinomonadaceae bacterium]
MQFVNPHTGWIVGPRLLLTVDGGKTWKVIHADGAGTVRSKVLTTIDRHFTQFVDPQTGWMDGGDMMYRTRDGGLTWSETVPTPVGDQHLYRCFFFLTPDEGWVVSDFTYHTTDGGRSWKRLYETRQYADSYPLIRFLSSKVGFMLLTRHGGVYRTGNGGETWEQVLGEYPFAQDLFFLDERSGWVVGDNFIAHTSDGGQTWAHAQTPIANSLNDVFFTDERNGCAVGHEATILCTKDGGATWAKAAVNGLRDYQAPLLSVAFTDKLHGWAVGGNGAGDDISFSPSLSSYAPSNIVLNTDDGGQTWKAMRLVD